MTSLSSDKFKDVDDFENKSNTWPESISEFTLPIIIQSGRACPLCGIGLRLLFASDWIDLEWYARDIAKEFGRPLPPKGFSDDYEQAIFVFCDNPHCSYQAAGEYQPVRDVLTEWCDSNAPSWAEYVAGVADARGWL